MCVCSRDLSHTAQPTSLPLKHSIPHVKCVYLKRFSKIFEKLFFFQSYCPFSLFLKPMEIGKGILFAYKLTG